MELEVIKLKDKQEVQNIALEMADNGGCILRFTVYTPSMKHSDLQWDNHVELFEEDETEAALDRIWDLYKENIMAKKSKSKPMEMAEPVGE